jgi:hypothetical protein
MVDQDLPHQPGGNAEEMGAPFPRNGLPLEQPHEGLVYQRSCVNGVAAPFTMQITAREPRSSS